MSSVAFLGPQNAPRPNCGNLQQPPNLKAGYKRAYSPYFYREGMKGEGRTPK